MQGQMDSRALELAAEARQIARDAREQCQREYAGLWTEMRSHREETNLERNRMHAENQAKFDRLFRAQYIAIGLGMAISAALSVCAPFVLPKLFHP